jgi:hypothetical protein
MATGSRTLKLSILADVENLTKNLKSGSNDVQSFGDKMGDFGKKAAVAFAAAGAAIAAFAVASVKAAAEDETGQRKLQETLRATTGATADQIAGIDKYVTAQSIATATTDDQIRPALSRLATATGDLTKAQELLSLAQEISAATGKPLETVANALSKSFDGNNTALGKLGTTLSAADLKTMSHQEAVKSLSATYDGFIANQATTAEFKFRQIAIATQEAKEAIGAALLPLVQQLADYIIQTAVPNMNLFIAALTGQNGIVDGIDKSGTAAYEWGGKVRSLIKTVIDLKDELKVVAEIIAAMWVTSKIFAFVQAVQGIIAVMVALRTSALAAAIAEAFATGGANILLGAAALAALGLTTANLLSLAKGDSGSSGGGSTSTGALGNYQMSTGTFIGGSSAGGGGTGGGGGGGGGTGGGGTGGALSEIVGAKNLTELVSQLTAVSNNIADLQFLVDTNGISKAAGQKQLDALVKQFDVLSRQADALTAAAPYGAQASSSGMLGLPTGTTINLTVNGAIDSEGTARTVVNTLNDSFYRGTLGAGALVGAFDK